MANLSFLIVSCTANDLEVTGGAERNACRLLAGEGQCYLNIQMQSFSVSTKKNVTEVNRSLQSRDEGKVKDMRQKAMNYFVGVNVDFFWLKYIYTVFDKLVDIWHVHSIRSTTCNLLLSVLSIPMGAVHSAPHRDALIKSLIRTISAYGPGPINGSISPIISLRGATYLWPLTHAGSSSWTNEVAVPTPLPPRLRWSVNMLTQFIYLYHPPPFHIGHKSMESHWPNASEEQYTRNIETYTFVNKQNGTYGEAKEGISHQLCINR